ncbi:MAG: beta strand repeat-containing protein [Ilumatobacter sp.]|uniref:beta strand repeat-containing protein n=1 Tax=Ilumatobacter sp. TaxID=1967498 RepID=UPI00391AA216
MARAVKATAVAGVLLGAGLALDSSSVQGASFVVTSSSGDPAVAGSLPFQVAAANALPGPDVITFDPSVTGTITLDATLAITHDLTITGPGSDTLALTVASGPIVTMTLASPLTPSYSISGLELTGVTGPAMTANASGGSVALDDVDFSANEIGFQSNNLASLAISNSVFSGNTGRAIDLGQFPGKAPTVDFDGVVVDNGGAPSPIGDGIRIERTTDIDISDTTVTGQAGIGIEVFIGNNGTLPEPVTLSGVTATGNEQGVSIVAVNGPITVDGNSVFSNNVRWGLIASGSTDTAPDPDDQLTSLVLSDSVADGNGEEGFRLGAFDSVDIDDISATGNLLGAAISSVDTMVTVDSSVFDDNGTNPTQDGLQLSLISGTTTITSVTASGNSGAGVRFRQPLFGTPLGALTVTGVATTAPTVLTNNGVGLSVIDSIDVDVSNTVATGNGIGLTFTQTGPVALTNVTADGSVGTVNGSGAQILAATGAVEVTDSSFDGNAASGLIVRPNGSPHPTPSVVVDGSTADGNSLDGMELSALGAVTVRNGSSASSNGERDPGDDSPITLADGLTVNAASNLVVSGSTFDGNTASGARLGSTSTPVTGVTVSASTFDDNTGNGVAIVGHTGVASITGGSVSRNAGEPLGSGYGAGVLVGQSAATTGSVLVDGVAIVDNPVGVKTFGASAATVRDVDIDGHTGRAIEITQAGTDVTLTRITVDNGAALVPTGTGVLLQTVGSVDVNELAVTDQTETGLDVDGASGTVDIAGSDLTDNLGAGLLIDSTGGDVAIASTDVSRNRTVGVRVDTTDDVTVTSVTANLTVMTPGQSGNGIAISTSENVVVTNSVANDNDGIGIRVDPPFAGTLDAVTVSGGSYSRNGGQGVVVSTATGLTRAGGFSANANAESGLLLSNVGDVEVLAGTVVDDTDAVGVSITTSGSVKVTNTTVTDSAQTGLRVAGATDVTVTGSTFDRNGDFAAGAGLDLGDVAGPVSVQSSFFRSNDALGLSLRSSTGAVRLDGSTFALNVGAGADLGTISTSVGNVSSVGSTFRDNGETGLTIEGAGNVSLTDLTAIGNYRADGPGGAAAPVGSGAGLELRSVGDVTMVRPTVRLNGGLITTFPGGPAVDINTAADVSITGGSISDNHAGGVQTFFTGDISVSETVFADNDSVGFLMVIGGGVDLDGVTVAGHPGNGVVVNSPSDDVSVSGSSFSDNGSTALDVSGLTAAEGSLTIGDTVFTGNQSGLRFNASSAATTVTGSTFTSNPFALYGEVVGGLTVVDSTFESNGTAVRWYGVSGGLDVSSSTFSDNDGRAFEFVGATGGVSIARTTVTGGNQPSLFDTVTGAVTVDRSSFVENGSLARGTPASVGSGAAFESADPFSGLLVAIDVTGGVEITTSTITDNEVSTPLIAAEGTDITVRHSTIADNASQTQIGSDGAVVVDHSIVMGRADRSSFDATDVTATYSVLAPGTGLGGSTVEAPDPLLAPLAPNGTGTPSRYPLGVSPAVSFGDPSITGAPATDQTGASRIESVIDAGAVEFDPTRVQPDDSIEPLSPARFVDTRDVGDTVDDRFAGDGKLDAGDEYRVTIAGRGDVPADAAGVIVNVTAVGAERNGFVTVHPCVTPRPVTSSLNYTAGVNLGNEIVAGLSDAGELCLFTSGPAHLTVDVTGFIPADTAIELITPIRMMDTRPGESTFDDIGALGAKTQPGSNTFLLLATRGEIPRGTSAVILNVTAVGAESNGFVTVHPCVDPAPTASSLNHVAGVNRGNELVASLDSGGRICIFTSASIHLTVDVVGYVPPDIGVEPVDPARVLDTRPGLDTVDGVSEGAGKLAAGEEVTLQIGGRAGVPADARAAIVNVTAIGAESNGFVTVHPCVDPRPLTSSLNYVAGVNGGNEIIALLDDDGRMCLFSSGAAHLAVDVVGWLR